MFSAMACRTEAAQVTHHSLMVLLHCTDQHIVMDFEDRLSDRKWEYSVPVRGARGILAHEPSLVVFAHFGALSRGSGTTSATLHAKVLR